MICVQSCCSDEAASTMSSQPASDVESNATNDTDIKNHLPGGNVNDDAWTEVNLNDDDDSRHSNSSPRMTGKLDSGFHKGARVSTSTIYAVVIMSSTIYVCRYSKQHRPTERRETA